MGIWSPTAACAIIDADGKCISKTDDRDVAIFIVNAVQWYANNGFSYGRSEEFLE